MLLSDYIRELKQFLKENGDIHCYYAVDIEGNQFNELSFAPSLFYVTELTFRIDCVYTEDDLDDYEDELIPICVVN